MIDQNSRPARKVGIADHLWETYEDMAQQMGSDRDALINQALFLFARLYGFIDGKPGRMEAMAPMASMGANGSAASRHSASRNGAVLAPVSNSVRPASREEPPPSLSSRSQSRPMDANSSAIDDDPQRRELVARVLDTADELERLIKGKGGDSQRGEPVDSGQLEAPDSGLHSGGNGVESSVVALYLTMDGAEPQRISKDRFVIGRGKHCDLVINSGKVSREHAVILREGTSFFIEDLGSSNGTWFNKQRIKRRKVDDGDEYFICSERVRLNFR